MIRRAVLLSLLGAAASGAAPAPMPRPTVAETLDVAPVWAGHPVGFALLTRPPFQFVAFYDAERRLTVAQRLLTKRQWSFTRLPVTTGWDSHNYLTLAADDEGLLHLSGNMHCVPLIYFRTAKPLAAATFERIGKMTGNQEHRTTYPRFFRGPRQEFIFTYRDGSSGNGNQIFNLYHPPTRTWSRLLDQPLTDGEGKRNAYFDGPVKGPDGYFHLAWVWRESPDAATNHDLSHARSKDLRHWENAAGKPLTLPIRLSDPVVVDPVPEQGGLINGNAKIGFDDRGRVTVSYHKHDASGHTQPWNARFENGGWRFYQPCDWPWRWDFGGGGTLGFAITLGPVTREADGQLSQSWRHQQFGGGCWRLDPTTLRAVGKFSRPGQPPEIGRITGTFPGLKVMTAGDAGAGDASGRRYLLRWETLPANRDQPRTGELPPPSMLRLYTLTR